MPAAAAAGARRRTASASTVAAAGAPHPAGRCPRPDAFDVVMGVTPEGELREHGRPPARRAVEAARDEAAASGRSGLRVGRRAPGLRYDSSSAGGAASWQTARRPCETPTHAARRARPDGQDARPLPARVAAGGAALYLRRTSHHWVDASDRVLVDDTAGDGRAPAASRWRTCPGSRRAGRGGKIFFDPSKTRVGIVTCGGLCPGLNNVIRGLVMELHPALRRAADHGLPQRLPGLHRALRAPA